MTYVVSITWIAKPGEEDAVADALRRLREPTRAEDGVIEWRPNRDPEDPRVFLIYEQYRDKAAFEAHGQTDHFKELAVGELFPLMVDRQRSFYETLD